MVHPSRFTAAGRPAGADEGEENGKAADAPRAMAMPEPMDGCHRPNNPSIHTGAIDGPEI